MIAGILTVVLLLLCFVGFNRGQRVKILKRDGWRCIRCLRSWFDGWMIEIDHIKPLSLGGKSILSNGRSLCRQGHLEVHIEGFKEAEKAGDKKAMNVHARAIRLIKKRIKEKGMRRYGY